jgi:flagellar biosynthesis protein FlhB
MSNVGLLFLIIGLLGSAWLGVFLARQLGEMLRTGLAGTMRGRYRRGRHPSQYWAVGVTNVLFLLLVFGFLVILLVSLASYLI